MTRTPGRHNGRHNSQKTPVVDASISGGLTGNQANDPLDELYRKAEEALNLHTNSTELIVKPPAADPQPRTRRIRVSMVLVPEDLLAIVRNFAGSRRIKLLFGKFNADSRFHTVYTSAAGKARLLEAFGEESDTL